MAEDTVNRVKIVGGEKGGADGRFNPLPGSGEAQVRPRAYR